MKRKLLVILVLAITAGCAGGWYYYTYTTMRGREVVVVDTDGAPVAGAQVVFQSMSTSQEPVTTGPGGRAVLRDRLPEGGQKWIVVTCEGYARQRLDFPEEWPVEIVLEPAAARSPTRPRNVQIIPR